VSYEGGSYVATAPGTGNLPTNTAFWQLLSAQGDAGATGTVTAASGVTLEHISTPSAPSSGNTIVYAKSDDLLYYRPASGAETRIGAVPFIATEAIVSLASLAFNSFAKSLGRSGIFTSFQATQPCWIVAYISAAARTADAARTITTDPLPGSGVLFEVVATNSSEIFMTPIVSYGVATDVFFRVRNTGASTQNINVTINGVRSS
jgi:hypothetical protein